MFSRRRKTPTPSEPEPKPADSPDVYVTSEGNVVGSTLRFFFTETLTDEAAESLRPAVQQQLLFVEGFSFRTYRNYVALNWRPKEDDGRYLDEVEPEVQLVVIGILATHFGWSEPDIGTFRSNEERIRLMKELGVEWTLGGS